MTDKKKPTPLLFVYLLNIIACFAVVLLHTTLPVYAPSPSKSWLEMVLLQSAAICATPLFFMISGMNLLGYRERYSTETFFRKRFWRVGRALLLGSVVCYLLYGLRPGWFYGAESFVGRFGLFDFVIRFLTNSINDTYWFFYSIIYLYALTPIISLAVKHRRVLEYMLGLLLLISIVFPFAERFGLPADYVNHLFGWPLFSTVSLLYFLGGYYLHKYWKPIRGQLPIMVFVVILSAGLMTVLTLHANGFGHADKYVAYYAGITSPLCVIESAAVFLLAQSLEPMLHKMPQRVVGWMKLLSGAALGIYLFHVLLINWMHPDPVSHVLASMGRLPIMKAVIVYAVTAVIVLAGKKLIGLAKGLAETGRS